MPTASTLFSWALFAALSILLLAGPALAEELDDELLADERKEVDADFTEQEAEPVAAEPERMKALSDVRWSKPQVPVSAEELVPPIVNNAISAVDGDSESALTLSRFFNLTFVQPIDAVLGTTNNTMAVVAIDRSPLSLSGIGDLMFLRPVTAALGVLGAATYGVVVRPTLLLDPSKHDALRNDLLYGPWRNLRERPLGEPTPVAEATEPSEPVDTAEAS